MKDGLNYKNTFLAIILALLSTWLLVFGETWLFSIAPETALAILVELRIPKVLSAISTGGLLALCGLLLQTYFQNPLAGPFVLGIHGGASLGVAIWIFLIGGLFIGPMIGTWGILLSAMLGSLIMMFFIVAVSRRLNDKSSLMIVGLLMGFFSSGVLSILAVINPADELQVFYFWTLGSFQRIGFLSSLLYFLVSLIFLVFALKISSRLNLLLLGDEYARSLGVNLKKLRKYIIWMTAIMIGISTSLVGPVAFIGLMSPHLARGLFSSADHQDLTVGCFLIGGSLALFAEVFSSGNSMVFFPLNATLSLVGIPLFLIIFYPSLFQARKKVKKRSRG